MKRNVTQKDLKAWRETTLPLLKAVKDPRIVAIARGGLSLAQMLAWRAGLDVLFYDTRSQSIVGAPHLLESLSPASTLFFVEDLVAEGRTYAGVKAMVQRMRGVMFDHAFYCAYLVDPASLGLCHDTDLPILWHESTRDWLVFPWEDADLVQENDRGLFRNRTSASSQLKDST